ncbi:hypothetical protein RvY_13684 [Ramazzottius varieornatus]|uniref:SH2 domain-containing protein n=1 Tax=Ramazzottius varieornatus TaxID=947166 RepID=A0A1D1VTY7_RAMVA|nr:hypothetical protein RvY_13684 [Ramazzottius varieornatus]
MLGDSPCPKIHDGPNGRTSYSLVNNIHINGLSHLNGQNGHGSSSDGQPSKSTTFLACTKSVMRNPKLFYESCFIARPKFTDAANLILQRNIHGKTINGSSPPSSIISNGSTTSGSSGLSTPDSLKGNLRKDAPSERKGEKKHVQFDLQRRIEYGNTICPTDDQELEEEDEEIDEIEKSLLRGYTEYSEGCSEAPSSRRKPNLSLELTAISTKDTQGERIDTELPLDQQTWYWGSISRQDAEEILRNFSEGNYLVRCCDSAGRREYSLACKASCGFMHLKVHRQPDDLYRLADFNRVFLRVTDLIEYYSSERLPIRGAEHMMLLHPVHQQLL